MDKWYKLVVANVLLQGESEELELKHWEDIKELVSALCSSSQIQKKVAFYVYLNDSNTALITDDPNKVFNTFCCYESHYTHIIRGYHNFEDAKRFSDELLGVDNNNIEGERVADLGVSKKLF